MSPFANLADPVHITPYVRDLTCLIGSSRPFNIRMSSETLSRRSFLGLEGQHVFITGAATSIGSEAVREFLGRSGAVVCSILVTDTQDPEFYPRAPPAERCDGIFIQPGQVNFWLCCQS